MNFFENITLRRNRGRTHSDSTPPRDDSDDISHTLEGTSSSLPDISNDEDCDQIRTLKEEIQILQSQLSSAHSEIELLHQENSKLKMANDDLNKKNQVYKKTSIGSPPKTARNQSTPKKKNPTYSKTKGTQTDTSEITNFSTEISSHINKSQNMYTIVDVKKPQQPPKKKKICVLSTDSTYRILTTAQRVLINHNDEICHYLTHKVGIEHLLRGIESKLADFTMEDYCIVLIGQEDFRITKDYHKLIIYIREVLKNIKHTNIILCFPTYTLRSHNSLYNARIETFNNLLYLDILVHEYAYHLDSNKNLTWDFNMFNKKSGLINDTALKTVFEHLKVLIDDIDYTNMEYFNENTQNIDIKAGTEEHEKNSCIENRTELFRN